MGMPVIEASGVSRCEAITDIIASVALVQAGLAHILNAEGEKIQRVVANTNATQEELLMINESVVKLVGTAGELEKVLISKLEIFKDCLCTCEEIAPDATITTKE